MLVGGLNQEDQMLKKDLHFACRCTFASSARQRGRELGRAKMSPVGRGVSWTFSFPISRAGLILFRLR